MTDAPHLVGLDIPPDSYADPVARYRTKDGEWKDGVRPPSVIETVEDVEWAVNNSGGKNLRLVCCFCADERRVRSVDEGQKWFRTHSCDGEGMDINKWLAA